MSDKNVPRTHKEPIKVLIIEDDYVDAALLGDVLSEAKEVCINLEHTPRLSTAIELANNNPYDAVLLDLGLPDSNGIETFTRVRNHMPGIPIVILTGHDDEKTGIKAVQMGAQDYLVKGYVDSGVLIRTILYSIERQKLREELKRRLFEIEKLERERKNVFHMIAHDMKNSITVSSSFTARLLAGKTGDLLHDLELIHDELRTAEDLIANFMKFSQFGVKPYIPVRSPFDIVALLKKRIESYALRAERKNIEIVLKPAGELMQYLEADREMIKRVITNLLDNAVKYTNPNGKVAVMVSREANDIVIRIRDTGIGMAPAEIPRIFEAFYRTKNDRKGSGLGLSIACTIIKAHGGKIWAESVPGIGSTFSFTLPVTDANIPSHGCDV